MSEDVAFLSCVSYVSVVVFLVDVSLHLPVYQLTFPENCFTGPL